MSKLANEKQSISAGAELLPLCEDPCFEAAAAATSDALTVPMAQRKSVRMQVSHVRPPIELTWLGQEKRRFQVAQIGEYGAGLQHDGLKSGLEIGAERFAQILISGIPIPIRCKSLYIGKTLAGVQFVQPPESIRLAIRSHFFLEHSAANLAPVHQHGTSDQGRYHRMTFTDPLNFVVDLLVVEDRLSDVLINLHEGEAVIRWEAGNPRHVQLSSTKKMSGEEIQAHAMSQAIGLIHNLRGLNPGMRRALETVLRRTKIC